MTELEFRTALSVLQLGAVSPRARKPKSLMDASEHYRHGAKADKAVMLEIKDKTLEELFEMYWKLRKSA